MQNKRPQRPVIDNFIPAGRPLGQRPGRPRQSFPDVGVTMPTYRGSISTGATAVRSPRPTDTKKKRKPWRWTKKRVILLLLLPFLLITLWLGIKFGFNAARIFNGNLFSIFTTTQLKGEENGRVNFLLAGNSADDAGHNGGELTDSIMIISLDTRNHKAIIISVPRDLYVDIDGYGHAKINEAYVAGKRQHFNENGYAPGGMGLLEKTLYENLGIKANYYALINYSALREAVNAVGGVDIVVKSDNPNGLYDPSIDWTTNGPLVDLSNGKHHLNGQQALDLARARGDARGSYGYANSDFTRTENQRKLLLSLKSEIFSTGVLANPIKVSNLFDSLGKNVKTDMELSEVRRLYDLMKQVDDGQLKSYGLNDLNGKNYLTSSRTSTGQSTLVPAAGLDNFTDIKQALRRLMSSSQVTKESAKVVVLNGTDVNGLASKNEAVLENRNITVEAVGDAVETADTTYIIAVHGTEKPATLTMLKRLYGSHIVKKNPYQSTYNDADFIIVLGNDKVASR